MADHGLGPINAVVRVRLAPGAPGTRFESCVCGRVNVREVWELTGDFDYEIRLVCPDLTALNTELRLFRDDAGAQETATCLLLRQVGQDTA